MASDAEQDSSMLNRMLRFLGDRGVSSECLQRMVEDKVDPNVISMMQDTELVSYLPQYGDRVAVRNFCRERTSQSQSKKETLLEKLRLQIALKRESRKRKYEPNNENGCKGNVNAAKNSRRIEIRLLMHDVSSNGMKNVRLATGGGTRSLSVLKNTTCKEVLQQAINLYFPQGESLRGRSASFTFSLLDYEHKSCSDDATVMQLYEATKLKMLRFYLCALKDVASSDRVSHSASSTLQVEGASSSASFSLLAQGASSSLASSTLLAEGTSSWASSTLLPEDVLHERFDHCELPDIEAQAAEFIHSHVQTQVNPVSTQADYLSNVNEWESTGSMTFDLSVAQDETLFDILSRLWSAVDVDGRMNIVNVDRDDILDGAFRAFERKNFDPLRQLHVRFSGEDGIDSGGPRRECMRLVLSALKQSNIFEGEENAKFISLDYRALTTNKYETAGRIISYCIVHRGPMPSFMHTELYTALSEGCRTACPTVDDITETGLKIQLKQILDAEDYSALSDAVKPLEEVINMAGCFGLSSSVADKQLLVNSICHFVLIDRARVAIEQFARGLGTLTSEMQSNPGAMKEAFVYSPAPLDATAFESLLPIAQWSEPGSNCFRDEKRAQTHWRDFLQDLEDEGNLSQLLTFITGLDVEPVLGFYPKPSLSFGYGTEIDNDDPRSEFPFANTCSNSLRIPLVSSYDKFKHNMNAALSMVTTFTAA